MLEVGMNRFRHGNQRCESFLVTSESGKDYEPAPGFVVG